MVLLKMKTEYLNNLGLDGIVKDGNRRLNYLGLDGIVKDGNRRLN